MDNVQTLKTNTNSFEENFWLTQKLMQSMSSEAYFSPFVREDGGEDHKVFYVLRECLRQKLSSSNVNINYEILSSKCDVKK